MLGIGKRKSKEPGEGEGPLRAGTRFVWDRSQQTWLDLREETAESPPLVAGEGRNAWSSLRKALAIAASTACRIRGPKLTWRLRAITAFVVFMGASIAVIGIVGIGDGEEPAPVEPPVVGTAPGDATGELSVSAPTNRWVDFYSLDSTLDGEPLPAGSTITVLDPDGVVCGAFSVIRSGGYGLMPVYGDDPYTETDEGAEPGDRLEFRINGVRAVATGPDEPTWTAMGVAKQVNLARPTEQ